MLTEITIEDTKRQQIFVVVYLLHILRFFNFVPYENLNNLLSAIDFAYALFFLFCFIRYINLSESRFSLFEKSIIILNVVFWASVINGLIGGQDPGRVLKWYSQQYLQFGFFFYLRINDINEDFLKDILKKLLIAYMIITVFSYLQYPSSWFGGADPEALERMANSMEDRGVMRFRLPAKMLVPFFIIYSVYNIQWTSKYFLELGLLFLFLLLIGNRFPMAVTILIVGYMILRNKSITMKMKLAFIIVTISVGIASYSVPFIRNAVDSLTEMTTENSADGVGDNNIRLLSAIYFFTEFNNDNIIRNLIGNGIPVYGEDSFSKEMTYVRDVYLFWESDVGYCEIFIYFGIIGCIALLLWCLGYAFLQVDEQCKYIKYYFSFIMIAMICGGYWFENFYIMSILSYLLIKSHETLTIDNDDVNLEHQKV